MAVHELFAYLCVADAAKAIEFYGKAFGAREKMRLTEPSGRIGHAEIDLGGTTLMVADEFPELGITGPREGCGTAVTLHLHVDNADAIINRAVDLGATLERAPKDEFYGERSGVIRDPFGHRWNIGHQIEQVEPDEMQRRYTTLLQSGS
jgi:uncharacterized glyoxalase superfamily protein PhnB